MRMKENKYVSRISNTEPDGETRTWQTEMDRWSVRDLRMLVLRNLRMMTQ
jgi:hypothetical protein